jgi:serine/threonine protein kinase
MLRQLAENPDNGCEPLGKQGARGALFRLTLESYGYVFVAKGTVTAFKAKLEHEGSVYRHLDEVQGELIPAYLGNISLVRPYFLDFGVRIVHMLLMSWAGEQARKNLVLSLGRDIVEETTRAVTKLRYHGVEHRDVRLPNVLWNTEGRKVMLVDFERAEILKQMPILKEISPNRKRKHLHSIGGTCPASYMTTALTDPISSDAQNAQIIKHGKG